MIELKKLLAQQDNQLCADCGAPDPKWASTNLGVFVCIQCSGVHRSLGVHISKIMSVSLDEWTADQVNVMAEVGGNAAANAIYEAYPPSDCKKPGPESSTEERIDWIRRKYEEQEFVKPALRLNSHHQSKLSSHSSSAASRKSAKPSFSFSSFSRRFSRPQLSSKESLGMVEFLGLLKVRILRGRNLAVRDLLTSDPYVVLTLGHQKAKTGVIKSSLNPEWNEELMLSVPRPPVPLKLQVYDYDKFSADDIMGEVEVDLQPLVAAASFMANEVDEDEQIAAGREVQIGRWLATGENALVHDSNIKLVGGQIKQQVALRLQNVESGELDLELEWVPLEQ